MYNNTLLITWDAYNLQNTCQTYNASLQHAHQVVNLLAKFLNYQSPTNIYIIKSAIIKILRNFVIGN